MLAMSSAVVALPKDSAPSWFRPLMAAPTAHTWTRNRIATLTLAQLIANSHGMLGVLAPRLAAVVRRFASSKL
jgi:hypothetical protein